MDRLRQVENLTIVPANINYLKCSATFLYKMRTRNYLYIDVFYVYEYMCNGIFADKFTDSDIIANAILLFSAGTDTVSITTSFCLYELALKRDIQDKLRAEINRAKIKYDGKFTNDFLMDLQYAEMVLNGNELVL